MSRREEAIVRARRKIPLKGRKVEGKFKIFTKSIESLQALCIGKTFELIH